MIEQLQFQYLFLNQNLFVYDFIIILLIPTIHVQTIHLYTLQNKLADPTTITDCDYGDDEIDHKIVVFIGTTLEKAAKGSLAEILSLYTNITNFINSLPKPIIDCISTNDEVDELAVAYNVKGVDLATIEKKFNTYLGLHFFTFHKQMVDLDNLWYAGNYYQFGFNGAGYLHLMLTKYIKQMSKGHH